jgi:hypothetical protein
MRSESKRMTVFDLLVEYQSSKDDYEFYSINNAGKYIYFNLASDYADPYIIYYWGYEYADRPFHKAFVEYQKIMPFLFPVTIRGEFKWEFEARNPFVCMRGRCLKPCKGGKVLSYGFLCEDFCNDGIIDGNDCISRFPTIYEMLVDVIDWHMKCPEVDAIVFIPEFFPEEGALALDTNRSWGVIKILLDHLEIITECDKANRIYREYEAKYPTHNFGVVSGDCP